MSAVRLALVVADGALVALFVLRLVRLKRSIDGYRPSSPLPYRGTLAGTLTITRVS